MQPREELTQLLTKAFEAARESGALPIENIPEIALERPRDEGHGDWACTAALRCAKEAKKNPREIAQAIVDGIPANDLIENIEIAGPGFINFRLKNVAMQDVVSQVREQGADYGKGTQPEGKRKVNIEYISANPTGPMHVGHGRWAALGSATANLMRHAGYEVFEEFYINDHGVQMDKFGLSIAARYLQQLGHEDAAVPEGGYNGLYVNDIAKEIIDRDGNKWEDADEHERMVEFREFGYAYIMKMFHDITDRFGNHFERWQSEREMYLPSDEFDGKSPFEYCIGNLKDKGDIYEKDGAVWFKSSEYGDEKGARKALVEKYGEMAEHPIVKMSKSLGNVVNPDDVVNEYGADTLRLYEMFIGDFEKAAPWNTSSIKGCKRFLDKIWSMSEKLVPGEGVRPALEAVANRTIKKVGEDIDALKANTAIAQLMILVNALYDEGGATRAEYEVLLQLLNPFVPHMTEELWQQMGHTDTLAYHEWPKYDEAKCVEQTIEIAVQVNGKVKARIKVAAAIESADAIAAAKADPAVAEAIAGKTIAKEIYVKGRLVNIAVKG